MDLFGKRRIAELEAERDRLRINLLNESDQHRIEEAASANQLAGAKAQVEYLVRTIRDMDQEIYNMGQKADWASQRPHFVKLHDEMTARKVAESKRIGDLLRPQLIETYKPNNDLGKLQAGAPSIIDGKR